MKPQYDLGEANKYVGMCFTQLRFLTCMMKDKLREDGLWEDLIHELFIAALEAFRQGRDKVDARRFASRRIYAYLKSYGYTKYRGSYVRLEQPFSVVYQEIENPDERITSLATPSRPYVFESGLKDRILEMLRQASAQNRGMMKWDIYGRLHISAQELDWHLTPLLKDRQVIEVKRFLGKHESTILVLAGTPLSEQMTSKQVMKERIRQAYFVEKKSIKQIAQEYYHDIRTVRKVVYDSPVPAA